MNIRIPTTIVKVVEKEKVLGGRKDGDTTILVYEKIGWFVHFEGSYEMLFVGTEKPQGLVAGAEVDILIVPRGK